jgi:hypothetical protein
VRPGSCPQFTAEQVFERLNRWNRSYQGDVLRLVQRVDWLRRVAPEWPPERYQAQWAVVLDMVDGLRPAATELVELLAFVDETARGNLPAPRRPPSPRRLARQAGGR